MDILHNVKCIKCNSDNIKCLETKIEEIIYKCIKCGEIFKIFPSSKLINEFNG